MLLYALGSSYLSDRHSTFAHLCMWGLRKFKTIIKSLYEGVKPDRIYGKVNNFSFRGSFHDNSRRILNATRANITYG